MTVTLVPATPALAVASVSANPVALTGTGAPGGIVDIFDNGAAEPFASLAVDGEGNFAGTATLAFGSHTLTATETINGTTSAISATAVVQVVDVPAPIIAAPGNGLTTNYPSLTVRGTGASGATVTLYDNGLQVGTALIKKGVFTLTIKVANGAHAFTAAQTIDGITGSAGAAVNVSVVLAPIMVLQPSNYVGFIGGSATLRRLGLWGGAIEICLATERRECRRRRPSNPDSDAPQGGERRQLPVDRAQWLRRGDERGGGFDLGSQSVPGGGGGVQRLFMEAPAEFESSGLVTLNLTTLGRFTGRLTGNGAAYNFSGGFSVDGQAQATASRGAKVTPLTLTLNLGLTNPLPQVTGAVSDGTWLAPLQADRAVFSAAHPCPESGYATALLGDGYASVTVAANGHAALRGYLPDNAALVPGATSISTNGQWPIYVPLYGKAGALFGWLAFTNDTATNFSGDLVWVRTNKFTNILAVAGSTFVARSPFLGWTNFQVTLTGGDLAEPLTTEVALLKNGAFKALDGAIPGLVLSVNALNGIVSGRFTHPTTRTPEAVRGIVFQAATNAGGYFYDKNGSGSFVLTPANH